MATLEFSSTATQQAFLKRLRMVADEQKAKFIEKAVEEYRAALTQEHPHPHRARNGIV